MARIHQIFHRKRGYLGTLKIVRGKVFKRGGVDRVTQELYSARLPREMRDLTYAELYNALNDYYEETCHCDFDCCGHFFGGIVELHKSGRNIAFRTHYQRNC